MQRIIVLSVVALLCVSQSVIAHTNSTSSSFVTMQLSKKVTVDVKNKSVREVLYLIQKQTKLNIVIQDEDIDELPTVTLSMKDRSVEEVLTKLLQGTTYEFRVKDNSIAIAKKIVKKVANSKSATKKVTIKGVVVDDEKKVVPGATLIVKGTTSGAISDSKGMFIVNAAPGTEIEISYVGMENITFTVKNDEEVTIKMKKDELAVDDVVVTGYGDVKKSSYTGNAVTVGRDQLLKVSKTNILKGLQAFDPSFRIMENNLTGSDPNALPEVYIRGESGIGVKELDKADISKSSLKTNPNLPTFIMDGFEISVTKLYDFDPNRIESVTILKDAAATALYGSRAANGVVVIKTVAPKEGRLNISYNIVGDITYPDLSDYNLMNASEKLELERRGGCYDPVENVLENYSRGVEYNEKLANVLRGVDTYWLSQPLRSVFNHKHSLYVDGGGENFRFGFDVNYANQDGVMKGSARDRMGAGLNLSYIYKTLQIQNNVSYSQSKSKESPFGNFANYTDALPYDVFQNENGEYYSSLRAWNSKSGTRENPLYESTLNNYSRSMSQDFINNLSLNWNITKYLTLKGQLSITKVLGDSESFLDPLSKRNSEPLSLTNLSSGELNLSNDNSVTIDANATLSYNRTIKKHNLNFMVGTNIQESNKSSNSSLYRGFPSGVLSSPNYAQKIYEKPSFEDGTSRLVGFLGTLNYSFNDIYLFDASVRMDGSSVFGSDKRFAPFWSFGTGINIHNYNFFRGNDVINQLRVRGSYGQVGKANFAPYEARTSYVTLADEWYKTGYGVVLQALGNPNLSWETTNVLDIGGEIALFQNLLYFKGSYYHKKTIDLVNDVTIPSSSGFVTYRDNVGEILNTGYEFNLRVAALRRKDMNLTLTANFAHNKNKITKISESLKAYNERVIQKFREAEENDRFDKEISTPFLQYVEGGSQSSIWGMRSAGINPSNGNEVFIRPNGAYSDTWRESDQVILGTREPVGQGSLGLSFNYKRFTVYANFMYEFGGQRYNQTLVNKVENANIYSNNVDRRVLTDRWSAVGDVAQYKSMAVGRNQSVTTRPTSRFVQDYNVLSLNSISVGYDLSDEILKKLSLSMVRFEVGANDIFRISTVKQERGLSYPFARIVNFSIKISL